MNKIAFLLIACVACLAASCGFSTKSSDEASASQETVQLTKEEASASIKMAQGKLTVIDFNATWCGPCREFAPIFEEAQSQYADKFEFQSIDVDNNKELAQKYAVEAIPTVVVVDANGNELARNVGFMDKDQFAAFLNGVK